MSTTVYRVRRDSLNPDKAFTLEDGSRPDYLYQGQLVQFEPLTQPSDAPPAEERLRRCVYDALNPGDYGAGFLEDLDPKAARPPQKFVTLTPGAWSTRT